MQKLALLLLLFTLTACSEFPWVYKIDIEQGNIIEQEAVDQLMPGLSKSQVRFILGSPILIDTFNQERWDYIYSMAKGGKNRQQERLSLFFKDNSLDYFTGDFIPSSADPKNKPSTSDVEIIEETNEEELTETIMESVDEAAANNAEEAPSDIINIQIEDQEGEQRRVY